MASNPAILVSSKGDSAVLSGLMCGIKQRFSNLCNNYFWKKKKLLWPVSVDLIFFFFSFPLFKYVKVQSLAWTLYTYNLCNCKPKTVLYIPYKQNNTSNDNDMLLQINYHFQLKLVTSHLWHGFSMPMLPGLKGVVYAFFFFNQLRNIWYITTWCQVDCVHKLGIVFSDSYPDDSEGICMNFWKIVIGKVI